MARVNVNNGRWGAFTCTDVAQLGLDEASLVVGEAQEVGVNYGNQADCDEASGGTG